MSARTFSPFRLASEHPSSNFGRGVTGRGSVVSLLAFREFGTFQNTQREEAMKQYSHNLTLHARTLRKRATPAEQILWQRLRRHKVDGLKFKRQHRIGRYVVDFYCGSRKLIVELEGGIHAKESQREYDDQRFEQFHHGGYRVLRFRNEEVLEDIDGVFTRIVESIREPSPRSAFKSKRNTPLPILGEGSRGEGQ